MAHSVISDIVLNAKVMNTVNGHSSVEGVMNCIVTHVGGMHRANHVEMDWIRSKYKSLTDVGQFDTIQTARG